MDIISSCISLLQIIHPMEYTFGIIDVDGKQRIRSIKLITDIGRLQKKICSGQLVIAERQLKLNGKVKTKVIDLLKYREAPDNAPFVNTQWFSFLGFYNIAQKRLERRDIIEIVIKNYADFLPYIDSAQEVIKEIEFSNINYV